MLQQKKHRRLAPGTSAAQNMNFARNSKKNERCSIDAYIHKSKAVVISKSESGNSTHKTIQVY
jgi:hypothetical protein